MKSTSIINKHKIKNSYHLIFKTPDKNVLEFECYFTKAGSSIYAHFDKLTLVAGSQAENEKEAVFKATMRLLQLISLKLLHSSPKQILKETGVDLTEFNKFLKKSKFVQLNKSKTKIPIYEEHLEVKDDTYTYSFINTKKTINDLKDIQKSALESINRSESKSLATLKQTKKDTIEINYLFPIWWKPNFIFSTVSR